jgi:hypothetical protein
VLGRALLSALGNRPRGWPPDPLNGGVGAGSAAAHTPFSQRGYVRGMSADLTPRDAIELLLTAKNKEAVHYGQVTLTVEQVDQIIGALAAVR